MNIEPWDPRSPMFPAFEEHMSRRPRRRGRAAARRDDGVAITVAIAVIGIAAAAIACVIP